jgi:hypothetical protein
MRPFLAAAAVVLATGSAAHAQQVLSAGGIYGGPAQPSAGPVELTERQMDQVTAGAGKVAMQDFHFVMKQNSSSPGLRSSDLSGVMVATGVNGTINVGGPGRQ